MANGNFLFFPLYLFSLTVAWCPALELTVWPLNAARCLVRDQTARRRRMHGDNTLRDGKCLALARIRQWDVEMYLRLVKKALKRVPDISWNIFSQDPESRPHCPFFLTTDGIKERFAEACRAIWIKLKLKTSGKQGYCSVGYVEHSPEMRSPSMTQVHDVCESEWPAGVRFSSLKTTVHFRHILELAGCI